LRSINYKQKKNIDTWAEIWRRRRRNLKKNMTSRERTVTVVRREAHRGEKAPPRWGEGHDEEKRVRIAREESERRVIWNDREFYNFCNL